MQQVLAKENFQIENIYGNRWQWNQRKKPVDFLESRRYVLKLNNLAKVDDVLSKVDAKGIEYVNISRYEHSKIEQYRKDLKLKALQAAKEKAGYLVQGLGEQLGGVLEINMKWAAQMAIILLTRCTTVPLMMMMKAECMGAIWRRNPKLILERLSSVMKCRPFLP
jgi:uncharacterized protein YggE